MDESSYKFARMKLKSETAKSLHVCKIVLSDLGQSLNRLTPRVIEGLDKYLSPILFTAGITKLSVPRHRGVILRQAQDPQFCDTFGGQNWDRTRLIDTNQINEKHLVQSMVFFICILYLKIRNKTSFIPNENLK